MLRARFKIRTNMNLQVRKANGDLRRVFNPNRLFAFLLNKGIVSARFPAIPFLLGKWDDRVNISNLITNAGFAGVASRLNGDGSEAAFTYIAVGTGTTAANVADTTLETEITDSGLERAAATASRVTTDVTNDTAQLLKSFSVTGTKAVTESGVLNAGAAGTLLARQVFTAVNVQNGDTLQITWQFDVD
jgi:hypothetical protein